MSFVRRRDRSFHDRSFAYFSLRKKNIRDCEKRFRSGVCQVRSGERYWLKESFLMDVLRVEVSSSMGSFIVNYLLVRT